MIPESGAPLTMIRIRNPVTGISLESRIQDFLGYPCMKWLCWRGKGTREGRKPLDVCVGWQPRPQGFSLKNGWALGTRLRGPFCLVPSLKRSLFLHSARQSLCARSHHSPLALLACLQLSHVISRFISLSSLSAPHATEPWEACGGGRMAVHRDVHRTAKKCTKKCDEGVGFSCLTSLGSLHTPNNKVQPNKSTLSVICKSYKFFLTREGPLPSTFVDTLVFLARRNKKQTAVINVRKYKRISGKTWRFVCSDTTPDDVCPGADK